MASMLIPDCLTRLLSLMHLLIKHLLLIIRLVESPKAQLEVWVPFLR